MCWRYRPFCPRLHEWNAVTSWLPTVPVFLMVGSVCCMVAPDRRSSASPIWPTSPTCCLLPAHGKLSHGDLNKMDAILQTTFSNAFSWMKMFEFPWNLLLMVVISHNVVQIMAWHLTGNKPVAESVIMKFYNVIRHQTTVSSGLRKLEVVTSSNEQQKFCIFQNRLYG